MLHFLQMGSVGTFTSWHGVCLIGSSFQKRTLIRLGKAGYHSFPKHLEEYAVRVHTVVGQFYESTLKNIFPILERVIFFYECVQNFTS